mgnify:CR=1 FL=1
MKENSFKRNRKVLTALLLCTGFIAAQPLAVMAEDSVTSVHAVQQQKQTVTGIIKDATGEAIIGASYFVYRLSDTGTTCCRRKSNGYTNERRRRNAG